MLKKFILSAFALTLPLMGAFAQENAQIKFSVLGDSYSTFKGIIPAENATWYPTDRNDVKEPEQTWWGLIEQRLGWKLEMNNSFSGSTVCYSGYAINGNPRLDMTKSSFITRACDLGFPDYILVCGATNDSWAHVPMGDFKFKKWTKEDLYFFRPAMAKMCEELVTLYPEAKVVFILNNDLSDEVDESVHKICKHYKIQCVDLVAIDRQAGNPSILGMDQIATQVIEALGL